LQVGYWRQCDGEVEPSRAVVSEANVELHRRAAAAYTARDVEAFIACFDPSVEFRTEFAALGGWYRGHGGIRKFLRDFEDAWGADMRIEPEAYFDLGERTLLFLTAYGRGSGSGAEVVMSTSHVIRWRDGLAISFRGYSNRTDALSELGVSEDMLVPIDP
jgi:ketosteroid isomerase-like protein